MNIRIVLKTLGLLTVLLGILMVIPGLVSAIYREPLGIVSFGIGSLLAIIAGLILKHFSEDSDMSHRDAFVAVSLSWLLAAIIGALPYLVYRFQINIAMFITSCLNPILCHLPANVLP
jgi:trk system potassium uptake protein